MMIFGKSQYKSEPVQHSNIQNTNILRIGQHSFFDHCITKFIFVIVEIRAIHHSPFYICFYFLILYFIGHNDLCAIHPSECIDCIHQMPRNCIQTIHGKITGYSHVIDLSFIRASDGQPVFINACIHSRNDIQSKHRRNLLFINSRSQIYFCICIKNHLRNSVRVNYIDKIHQNQCRNLTGIHAVVIIKQSRINFNDPRHTIMICSNDIFSSFTILNIRHNFTKISKGTECPLIF